MSADGCKKSAAMLKLAGGKLPAGLGLALLAWGSLALAGSFEGAVNTVLPGVVNSGGQGEVASANYDLIGDVAETGQTTAASANYIMQPGFANLSAWPETIIDLAAAAGAAERTIDLSWTAPGADGSTGTAAAYEIRVATIAEDSPALSEEKFWLAGAVTDYIAVPAPGIPGAVQQLTVPGLEAGTTYYFAIKARSASDAWGYLSNAATAPAQIDMIAPSAVSNLAAVTGTNDSTLDLAWNATGDNAGAGDIVNGKYRIDYSTTEAHVFEPGAYQLEFTTSVAQGQAAVYRLSGLLDATTYYVRVYLADEAFNFSPVSNGTTAQTRVYAPATGRYWVGGAGFWSETAHWSTTSGGEGGAPIPTAADNVYFDANSGAGIANVNQAAYCQDLDFTGFSNTLSGNQPLNISGSLTLSAGMTLSYNGAMNFLSSSPGRTLTFNGRSMLSAVNFNGPGGIWTVQDQWYTTGAITLTAGTLDTNGKTVTTTGVFSVSGAVPRTLILGASTLNCGTWTGTTTTDLQFNPGTSIIKVTAATTFNGGGLTYNEVQLNSTAHSVVGANTFAVLTRTAMPAPLNTVTFYADQVITGTLTLAGNSEINRLMLLSSVKGTARILNAGAVSASYADFQDISGAGAANWNLSVITGLSGDAGGNSGITFTPAATQYWFADTGNWSNPALWYLAPGGGGGAGRIPLPQDNVVFDADSFTQDYQTVSADMPRLGKSVTFAGVANTPTITFTIAASLYGSLTLGTVNLGPGTNTLLTFEGRGAYTLTSNGLTFERPVTFDAPGGSLTLQDPLTLGTLRTLTLNNGVFNANDQDVTAGLVASANAFVRTITMGSGTWTLTGAGTVWNLGTITNLTLNQNTSTIKLTDNSAANKTFTGGALAYNNFWNATQGAGYVLIAGSNFFNDFKIDAGRTARFTAGTTQTVVTFSAAGSDGNPVTLESSGAAFTLKKIGGGSVAGNYLSISNSAAIPENSWYAGAVSTDGVNNTGWLFTTPPAGADRYWVGGVTGDWSNPNNWSSASGQAGGASVPTASDNVFFDAASGNGTATVDVAAYCVNLNFTGYTGTFAGAAALTIYGSLTLSAGMNRSFVGNIDFGASTVGHTITFAGNTMQNITTFSGIGGGWTLQDDWNNTNRAITLSAGALDTNGKAVTTSGYFYATGALPRALTLGASTLTCGDWSAPVTTNLTFDAGTSTIAVTTTGNFDGGGLTYNAVALNGIASITVGGANTFAVLTRTGTAATTNTMTFALDQTITGTLNLNGNSTINRLLLLSSVRGAPRTISAAAVSAVNADFQDITGAGAADWDLSGISGLSGDAGGNSGITFTGAQTNYWVGGAGNWSDAAEWASSSGGGAGSGRVPLPQDNARFDANSFGAGGLTVTANMPRLAKSIDFTGVTNTPALTLSGAASVFGSLTLDAITLNATGNVLTFEGRGSHTLTSAGLTFENPVTLYAPGGTLTLQDPLALGVTRTLTIANGTFNANNKDVTAGFLASGYTLLRTITMGSGTWSLSGSGTVWNLGTAANIALLTLNPDTSTIKLTNNSTGLKTFAGGVKSYYNFWNATQDTGKVVITGSNVFNDFKIDAGRTQQFTNATNQTVNSFTAIGTAADPITLESSIAAPFTLSKAGGGVVSGDYLSISSSTVYPPAAWYAGAHSTDGGANTNWSFTAAPVQPAVLFCEGQSNPQSVLSVAPVFSAIYVAANPADSADYYQVQVDSDSAFGGPVWDSGKASMALCGHATRCENITYGGPTPLDTGKKWYWRIKYWTAGATSGNWSNEGDFFRMYTPPPGRYWVGGGGDWSDTAHWGTFSGDVVGGASVPTATDNVFFDGNSGTGTALLDAAALAGSCANLDFTGYGGTFAGSIPLNIYGSLTMGSGMTRTYAGAITFGAGSAENALTFNGIALNSAITFNGTGSAWTLQDDLVNNGAVTLTAGTLNTNGNALTASGIFTVSGAGPRALNLSSSTLTCGDWTAAATTNLVFDAGTSTIAVTTTGTFDGGGLTYNAVLLNGIASITVGGSNTFAVLTRTGTAATTNTMTFSLNQIITGTLNLTGNSAVNRLLVLSSVKNAARTLDAAAVTAANADFQDITGVGSWDLSAAQGGSGDAGGNNGITFTPAANQYWFKDTGLWSNPALWFLGSGGTGGAGRVPLPQDDVFFDVNSFSGTGYTVTANMPRLGKNISFDGGANYPSISLNTTASVFGSLAFGSGTGTGAGGGTITFEGRSAYALTSGDFVFDSPVNLDAPNGTLQLQDSVKLGPTRTLTVTNGSFDANNKNVEAGLVAISNNANVRSITMGSGTWTLTGAGNVWYFPNATNLTLNPDASTIKLTNNSAALKTFTGAGKTYYNFWNATEGAGNLLIAGSNFFNDFKIDAGRTVWFTAATNQTVNTFTAVGTAVSSITLESNTLGVFTLTKAGGGAVACDNLLISSSTVNPADTWYAGANSTNAVNNTGWSFTPAPGPGSPVVSATDEAGISAAWTPAAGSNGYVLEASTEPWPNAYAGNRSSATAASAAAGLTVLSLAANTTYYLRAGAVWGIVPGYSAVLPVSTATLAVKPSTAAPAVLGLFVSSATLGWLAMPAAPESASALGYELQASTAADFTGLTLSSVTPSVAQSTLTVAGLWPNTTYYFRTGSINHGGARNFINLGATATLADSPQALAPAFLNVYPSSVTANWAALPAAPSSATSQGYLLEASSTNFSGGIVYSSSTPSSLLSTLTVAGLAANTTYYFRAGSLNWNSAPSYLVLGSTSTPANAPQRLAYDFTGAFVSSITARWQAMPAAPSSSTSAGYLLEASSTNFNGGLIYSSQTSAVELSTLTVSSLDANTTYYFRVGAVNWNSVPTYLVLDATATLANAPAGLSVGNAGVAGAALTWSQPIGGAEGYRLQASSTNFNGTGVLLSSATPDGAKIGLAVSELLANTTYFFRVGALNWNGTVNFSNTLATSTLSGLVGAPGVSGIFLSSAAVTWAVPAQGAEGYELRASSTDFNGTGELLFSSSTNGGLTGLSVQGLLVNTTYFFRAGSLNWNNVLNFTVSGASSTLANVPAGPAFEKVYVSSATVNWAQPAGGAEGYLLEACAAEDFSGLIISSSTPDGSVTALTVVSLQSETTYYFRAGALNWDGAVNFAVVGATRTLSSVDMTGPGAVDDLAASTDTAGSAMLAWSAPLDSSDNPLGGVYAIQHSTWAGVEWATTSAQVSFSTSGVIADAAQWRAVGGLDPNTTYFFRLWTSDIRPNWSPISNGATVATLADLVTGAQPAEIFLSSVTVSWNALPVAPASATCSGYVLEASSTDFTGGTVYSSSTLAPEASLLTLPELDANTTYYFRVGSLNRNGAPNYAPAGAVATLANKVSPLAPAFVGALSDAVTARWAALPAAPAAAGSEGYVLEASSTGFTGGVVYSSATDSPLVSTLTVAGLDADTTYYFRAGSLNWGAAPNYTALGSTATLANQPQAAALAGVFLSSAALAWDSPAGGAQGYELRASSTDFDGTGLVLSSATADGALLTLTVSGLAPNTTWFFKAGSLNHNGSVNFAAALSASTLAEAPQKLAFDFTGAFVSSVTARWSALPAAPQYAAGEGYVLEASSTNFSGGVVYSSATSFVQASTLTVSDLDANTTYYFRVGSLDWNAKANYTVLAATSTLAVAPEADEPSVTLVGISSIAAQWLDYVNPAWTLYRLDLSTSAGFDGALLSSVTFNLVAARAGLAPNTTYYVRVGAINNNGVLSGFAALGSTITLAAQPTLVAPAFAPVNISSLAVSFGPGSPQNPEGTFYQVQLSSFSGFNAFFSSVTANQAAAFQGLAVNTTYYSKVRAMNSSGLFTEFTSLNSTSTLAVAPGQSAAAFTEVTAGDLVLNWSSGTVAAGYNPQGTAYSAQLSTAADFTGELFETVAQSTVATVGGLLPGTTYYARVKALNHQGRASGFALYGSTKTLDSAKPGFIPGTLAVADSLGQFLAPGAYTDTLTPAIRVNLQSAFAPGLAVTENPAQLALWHFNDGAGAAAKDDSNYGRDLALNNSPAWITGKLGGALDFNGTNAYGVSPTLTPWRNAPVNNQFSVSLWFRAAADQARGFLFQAADANAAGAGAYDSELSWHDTTGKLSFEITTAEAGRRIIQAPSSYADGAWHFAAAVLNTAGMYLYVDGALAQTGIGVNSNTARTYAGPVYLWVGAASVEGANLGGGAYRFFPGDIDEVLVSTVAFTAAQVQELYALNNNKGVGPGAPAVELSTRSGADLTWTRISTAAFTFTGADGSTAQEVFTSSLALSAASLRQTAAPGADTNQVLFIAASLDSKQTAAQFTVLVDTTPPPDPAFTGLSLPTTFSLALTGLSGSDDLSGLPAAAFKVQASGDQGFGIVDEDSGFVAGPDFTFTALYPNTTYFVRAQARDLAGSAGNLSGYSAVQSLATLAIKPSTAAPAAAGVFITSATLAWTALPLSPSSASAQGYELQASTTADFTGITLSSVTGSVLQSALTVAELWPNTTYYFRVGSINHAGLRNYIGLGSTATLTDIPQAVSPEFLSAQTSSITAGWAALPPSPSSATAEGYTLEASSTDFDGGTVYSSTTLLSQTSALTVTGLEPNTTYYFRVGALNWNARPSYLVLPATATLAGAPPGFAVGEVFVSSAALAWDPPAGGAEGYELQASSTNFNGTGLLLSSATPDGDLTALALPDLLANTTYFFRVGALNWNGAVNFSAILATSTISGAVGAPGVSAIFLSSAAVTWAVPEQGAEGYELRASSTGFDGTGAVLFSSSTDGGLTGLEVQGLQVNTVYSFRAGSFNWNKVLNFAVAGTSSTLANVPANPVLTKVYISSVVLNWDLPAGGAGGYVVEASTVADFTGLIVSSATTDGGAGGITVISLDSETTFYFRAGALNWDGVGNFVYVGSTLTHSSTDMAAPAAVGGLAAAAYSANAALLTWSGPADATNNPLNGTYAIQYSTWTGVEWSTYNAQVIFSTSGVNPGAPQVRVVEGLDANTTYYFQLWTADTRPNWSPISNGATVATLADQVVGTEAAAVYLSSLTVNWAALPAGPSSATCQGYRLEASSVNFEGGVVYSSQTAEAGASALTLAELDSNTTYYFRVGSLNWNASPNYALTGSTSTLAKAVTPLVPVFTEVFSSAIKARWAALPAAPSSSTGEGYLLEASSSNFDGTGTVYSSATADAALNALTIEDLAANTTYYFRAGSLNWNSRPNYTALGATATLANQPQAAALAGVFLSSAALAWDLPAGGAQGYELRASSTDFNGTGLVLSSATADGALLTLTVSGLAPNTTWFFEAGSLNHNGSVNFAAALSASTLAEAPQKLAYDFTGAFVSSVTARWAALPAAPQYAAGEGYVLEASSTNFSGGVVYSSATSFVQAYTLTVSDLDANTTYYFRVGSLDWNAKANYTVLSATSTLAVAPEADEPSVTLAGVSSIAAQWLDYVNPAWTLYRLDLSTSAGFDGALLSSVTFNLVAERAGLAPNTTYYARVAAQNNNGVLSAFASLGSTITLAAQPEPVEPAFAPVYSSSLTVSFGPGSPQNPDWTVYEVQLSSYPGFDSFLSSDTAAPAAAFQDLAPNTTWYARARAYNGSGIYTGFADLFSTATLAVPPGQAESTFSDVTANEFILYWSSGQAATGYNPEGTSYLAQLSTAADFDGELIASETQELYAAFGGLYPGANYYARVQALNHQGIATGFTLYGSTVTLTSAKPVFLGGLEVSDSQGNFIPASAYTDTTTPNIRINVQSVFAPGLAVTDNPSQLALWHLEDGAGGAAKDDSDHNRGLTLYNSPAWITGKLGSALQFDGSGSYGVSPTLVPWRNSAANSPFSISLWFRTTQAKGFIFQVADSDTAGAAIYDCELSWHDVTGKLALEIARNTGGVRYIIQAPSAYTDGEWHFVAAVLNPSGMYLFVDGAQVQSGTGVNSTSSRRYPGPTYLWLGAASVEGATMGGPGGSGDPYRFFAGDIDEVSVSTVALNLAQIQELYVLSGARGLRPGAPAVELSTQSGADFTWSRTSTAAFSITGANGSTAQEVFSSSLALSGAALRQTASPGADTNQVLFMAASLDSNRTTVQFTILVDTTPPAAPSFAPLSAPTTFSLTVSGLAGEDSLSGLHAAPFKVQASTDPAFGVISEDSGFISDTGFTFTTLEPDTLYYVRALARDAAGNVSAVSSSQERATLSGLHQPPGISPSGGGVLLF